MQVCYLLKKYFLMQVAVFLRYLSQLFGQIYPISLLIHTGG